MPTSGYTPKIFLIGHLNLVPYFRPGDPDLTDAFGRRPIDTHAMLLAHHGMNVCERDLSRQQPASPKSWRKLPGCSEWQKTGLTVS